MTILHNGADLDPLARLRQRLGSALFCITRIDGIDGCRDRGHSLRALRLATQSAPVNPVDPAADRIMEICSPAPKLPQ